ITASTGNHGSAVAYVLKNFGINGAIYIPENATWSKVEVIRDHGANLEFYGDDCVITENYAREIAAEKDMIYIPPYNDMKIIGGQGTIATEIARQVIDIDAVFVPVGGGGLISGIAGAMKSINKKIKIIGCQPKNSAVMAESIKAGKILDIESLPTLSDGTAGGIEEGSITFDICQKYVDDFVLVSEEEIKEGIKLVLERHYKLIEGAAALAVAGYIEMIEKFKNKTVVLVLSGAKISLEQLKEVLSEGD
ncbi:pyridoxal-phosphate dependent enzyme, partial [candidate division KSB1 bacterium]